MIRSRVLVSLSGLMAESTRELGRMANSTERVSISMLRAKRRKVSGMMARESSGFE